MKGREKRVLSVSACRAGSLVNFQLGAGKETKSSRERGTGFGFTNRSL